MDCRIDKPGVGGPRVMVGDACRGSAVDLFIGESSPPQNPQTSKPIAIRPIKFVSNVDFFAVL